jgi:tetratricopeptide (TPR) repeat protein
MGSAVSVLLLLLVSTTAIAQRESSVAVHIRNGVLNQAGDSAEIDLEVENRLGVGVRIVAIRIEYDAASGATLEFNSTANTDLRTEAGESSTHTITFSTDLAQGEFFDWRVPYSVSAAIGASVSEIEAYTTDARGSNADRLMQVLADIDRLVRVMRRASTSFEAEIAAIENVTEWFDHQTVSGMRPELEAAICQAQGERVRRARGNEARADMFREASRELLQIGLYPDCFPPAIRRTAARAMVASGRAQDALVLTQRNEDGTVAEDWMDVYIAGRLALAETAIPAQQIVQLRVGIESLNEILRYRPDGDRLAEVAASLLTASAARVERFIAEAEELEAFTLVEMLREHWSDHPQVERASAAMAAGLVQYGMRSLERDEAISANNAYVLGLDLLEGVPAWEEAYPALRQAQTDYWVAATRTAVAESRIGDATDALASAERILALDPALHNELSGLILQSHWDQINVLIDQENYEDAMRRADSLESDAEDLSTLGTSRGETYLRIANHIWDRYGMLLGLMSPSRLSIAEDCIERGRDANPEAADALASKLALAKWLFPGIILSLVLLGLAVVLLRGSWRKRRKAKGLWRTGTGLLAQGRLGKAVDALETAYELTITDDTAPTLFGEESRGHMVLLIASAQLKRGRKDQLTPWRDEWRVLDDWERPHSKDFDEALEIAGAGKPPVADET